tara:strand:+ start:903 stop:1505 length:603 start_codon:yes stop_codon:yes gene_type:complete
MSAVTRYTNQMKEIVSLMAKYPDTFDVINKPVGLCYKDLRSRGLDEMASFVVPLVVSNQMTDYSRDAPFVNVWLAGGMAMGGGPRFEAGQGPIYFDITKESFAAAVKELHKHTRTQFEESEAEESEPEESEEPRREAGQPWSKFTETRFYEGPKGKEVLVRTDDTAVEEEVVVKNGKLSVVKKTTTTTSTYDTTYDTTRE